MFEKFERLKTNQKIILGILSFLFVTPLFIAFLTLISYKKIRNKVLNGVVTTFLVLMTIFTGFAWYGAWFTDYENIEEPENEQEQVLSEADEKEREEEPKEKVEKVEEEKEEKQEELYKVTSVSDGDTFRVLINGENQTVRLIGLDTPEINHQSEPVQCYGPEAKEFTETTLLDKNIKLEIDEVEGETDQFDRLLRYVFLEDGTNFNELLIKEGYAWESTYTEGYNYQEQFRTAEQTAKENNAGFWSPETCNGDVYTGTYKDPALQTEGEVESAQTQNQEQQTTSTPQPAPAPTPAPAPQPEPAPAPSNSNAYSCNCGKTCGQMASCDEAYYQLNQCGCSARDGDNDGVPCESIC